MLDNETKKVTVEVPSPASLHVNIERLMAQQTPEAVCVFSRQQRDTLGRLKNTGVETARVIERILYHTAAHPVNCTTY